MLVSHSMSGSQMNRASLGVSQQAKMPDQVRFLGERIDFSSLYPLHIEPVTLKVDEPVMQLAGQAIDAFKQVGFAIANAIAGNTAPEEPKSEMGYLKRRGDK
jgi:hypothetical protein